MSNVPPLRDVQELPHLDDLALPLELPTEALKLALGQQGPVAVCLQLLLLPRELAHLALSTLQGALELPGTLLKTQVVLEKSPQLLLGRLMWLQDLQHILCTKLHGIIVVVSIAVQTCTRA